MGGTCCNKNINEIIWFCKHTDGKAMSLKVFNITKHILEENERNWENCSRLCPDLVQSMSG